MVLTVATITNDFQKKLPTRNELNWLELSSLPKSAQAAKNKQTKKQENCETIYFSFIDGYFEHLISDEPKELTKRHRRLRGWGGGGGWNNTLSKYYTSTLSHSIAIHTIHTKIHSQSKISQQLSPTHSLYTHTHTHTHYKDTRIFICQ